MARLLWSVVGAAVLSCAVSTNARADEGLQADRTGLTYEAGGFAFNLGGRLHLDAAQVDDTGLEIDDEEVRRARLELSVRHDDWRLRIDREFTNGGGWRNVWLSYDVNDDLTIKAGNFIAPFSMEDVGSSNETMFMERSLIQALAPGFGVGVGASYEGRHFGLSGGYFTDAIDAEDNNPAEKGDGVSLRATWSPIERRQNTVHFGLGLDRREFASGDTRTITSTPEASLAPTLVTSGALTNLDTSMSYNVEAAYSVGSLLLQGQYLSSTFERSLGGDVTADGFYVQAGWIVTGERHRYGDAVGVFTGPRPDHDWGAVELAARVSSLDLSEAGAGASGTADDYTVGVNWYLGQNFRLMANYVHSELDAVNPAFDRDVDVVQARAQLDF
jgi:phosphate-selective porin OprO/OprP